MRAVRFICVVAASVSMLVMGAATAASATDAATVITAPSISQAAPSELLGSWTLKREATDNGDISGDPEAPVISFNLKGEYEAQTGCNQLFGTFVEDAGTNVITFSEFSATQMMCGSKEMAAESALVESLSNKAVPYTVTEHELVLNSPEMGHITFTR